VQLEPNEKEVLKYVSYERNMEDGIELKCQTMEAGETMDGRLFEIFV